MDFASSRAASTASLELGYQAAAAEELEEPPDRGPPAAPLRPLLPVEVITDLLD